MPHGIEHLQPGDILICGGHTMIYIGGNVMVHAMPQSGLVRVNMLSGNSRGIWDGSWAYRPRLADLGELAAEYAGSWARTTSGPSTNYATNSSDEVIDNRGSGVKQQLKLGAAAPFLYDAFYRSFKWALRYGGVRFLLDERRLSR